MKNGFERESLLGISFTLGPMAHATLKHSKSNIVYDRRFTFLFK
jgi:hypothetical protein